MSFSNQQEMGRPVTIKDEGVALSSNVASIDFTGPGISGSAIGDSISEDVPGTSVIGDPVTPAHGGTGTSTVFTQYAVPFIGAAGVYDQDPTKFKYNKTSTYFSLHGSGTGTASALFHVLGTTSSHIGKFDIGLDFNQVAVPTTAISLSLLGVPGNVDVGSHVYRYTLVTALGETALNNGTGATTTAITTTAGNQQVLVSGLPVSTDYRVTHINIYRSTVNQPYYIGVKKVGQVANGVTTFTDNISDASRTGVDNYARPNTTNRFITVNGLSSMMIDPLNALFGYRTGESVLAGTAAGGENAIFGSYSATSLIGGKNAALGQNILVGSSDSSVFLGHNAGGIGQNFQNSIIGGRNAAYWNTQCYSSIILGGAKGPTYYTGSYITSVGIDALQNIATGAANLTTLGIQSGYNITTSVGSLILGAFVNAPSATTNGQFNAGNVLYGLGLWTGASSGLAGVTRSATPTSGAQIGVGIVPTAGLARFEIVAGSTTYVPLKLNSGPLRTTAVAGGIEFLTDKYYGTITTGAERRTFAMLESAQTFTATQRINASLGINVAPAYPLDVQGAVNSQSIPSALPGFTNITKANFIAKNEYNGYPTAMFLIGQNAADVNVSLTVGPLFATGALNKPAAIVVSTNASGVEATSYQTYIQQTTSLSQLLTLNRSGSTGATAGTPFAIGIGTGTSWIEKIRFDAYGILIGATTTAGSFYAYGNNRTVGMISSSTNTYVAGNGPYFAMRGNSYTATATQRGNYYISAGNPAGPAALEGRIAFFTGADVERGTFLNNGHFLVGSTTDYAYAVTNLTSDASGAPLSIRCSSASGYSTMYMLDNGSNSVAGIGYSNASAAVHASNAYIYTAAKEFFISTDSATTKNFKVDINGRVGVGMNTTPLTSVFNVGAGTTTLASITLTPGTAKTTPAAGDIEFTNAEDGLAFTAVATRRKIVLDTATQTLTNKRITSRIGTTASSATPTPNADTDDQYNVTALATNATFGIPSGTPIDGQNLVIRVKDNGTARTLAFNAIYRFSTDLAAPTTTILSKTIYLGFKYNGADTKWDCLAILNNF